MDADPQNIQYYTRGRGGTLGPQVGGFCEQKSDVFRAKVVESEETDAGFESGVIDLVPFVISWQKKGGQIRFQGQ